MKTIVEGEQNEAELTMVARDITFQLKLPDFSLIKIQFPWPNEYKMSDLVAPSNLNLKPSFQLTHQDW